MDRINTAIQLTKFEQDVLECKDCRVYEDRHYDQWVKKLGPDFQVHTLRNGMALDFGMGPVPLWSDYVLCDKHRAESESACPTA